MIQADTLAPFPPERRPALAGADDAAAWAWRALGRADLPWLVALYATTRAEELQPLPWPETVKQQFLAQQFVAQHQHYLGHYPQAHYLAIDVDGQPVGRVYIDETGEDDLLVDISLLPAWRGRGLGTTLIHRLQRSAAMRGRGLRLHVQVHNPAARRLYERLGFIAGDDSGQQTHVAMRWAGVS
ncbi:GNAT family N-acetyltransferase [Stenotrophomonas sp. GZD-301]|uniref:GNAT family N-acetyltransferase n=1 Tax=Stenotrophomonas sp. GZD-301 TaxID=3404814 RepID=UPI003BB6374E